MYKLTIEFKNKEELLAHLAGETATVAAVETSIAVDPVAEKKKAAAKKAAATRAANKAKKDAEASVVVEPSMTLPVFDRDGCLAAVIAKKDEVEKLGFPLCDELMGHPSMASYIKKGFTIITF